MVAHFTPLLMVQARYRIGATLLAVVDAEDVVAEAWLVALRRLRDLVQEDGRQTPRLLAFLSTTIVHIINHRLEKHLRHKRVTQEWLPLSGSESGDPIDRQAADITGAVTHAFRGELSALIEAALSKLQDKDRQVVILRGIEGLSNNDAAEVLGEHPDSISHRYRRALVKLRERLPSSILGELEDS